MKNDSMKYNGMEISLFWIVNQVLAIDTLSDG